MELAFRGRPATEPFTLAISMHLTRCKDQQSKTLEEFYNELALGDNYTSREGGKAMLELIESIRAEPGATKIFGLTSHARLVLLAEDTYESPWFVIISALDSRNYRVEYLMPSCIAPWPGAYVCGECRTNEDAVRMVTTAIHQCEGWIEGDG
ncbi:MAG: hypothetical protein R3B84_20745 [Zavarzinella sp.]